MNLTYYCTIKAILYKVIFNYKLPFEHLNFANCYFTEADIKKYIYNDNQDDFLILKDKEGQWLEASNRRLIRKFGSISEMPNHNRVKKIKEDSTKIEDEEDSQEKE